MRKMFIRPLPRKRLLILSVVLALFLLSAAWIGVIGAARILERQAQNTTPDVQREREAEPNMPSVSFIDSPNPTCDLPIRGTNICYIEWSYFWVNAGSNYMISMTVSIDDKIRANSQGFFQNSMYIPGDMLARGFQVACGVPGASGNPALGQAYAYTIRARDSVGLNAANYGNVTCPADVVSIAQLNLAGPTLGTVNSPYTFDATVLPITSTLPVTYTWTVSDYPVQILTGGATDSKNFTWNTPGVKTITVEARNLSSLVSQSTTILIEPYKVFMALVKR